MSPQEQIVARFAPTERCAPPSTSAIRSSPVAAIRRPAPRAASRIDLALRARPAPRRRRVELLTVDTAGKSVGAASAQRKPRRRRLLRHRPLRGADIAFTRAVCPDRGLLPPVRDGSPLRSNVTTAVTDRPRRRRRPGQRSYDLHLSRGAEDAAIVRAPGDVCRRSSDTVSHGTRRVPTSRLAPAQRARGRRRPRRRPAPRSAGGSPANRQAHGIRGTSAARTPPTAWNGSSKT